jgi:hypothetical protein
MAKKYIDGETKDQRKTRKAFEKTQKTVETVSKSVVSSDGKYYVLCLKHGTKYSADYVNKLYSMVQRHCTLDFEMVCLTDDSKGIDSNITVLKLPGNLQGWWCKPYMFSNELPLNGTVLYMDLDIVIANNIDQLFTWEESSWCTIRDFTRKMRPTWQKYNSSVVRFRAGELHYLWEDFAKNRKLIQRKFHGDQDWLYEAATRFNTPAKLYPDNWIMSWKWEIRQSKDLNYRMSRGLRTLRTIEKVRPPKDCAICVFHGDPNPNNCEDPWVVDNWR